MTITELAILRLTPPTTTTTPSLLSNLANAKQVMESYTHHNFHILQQIEDPSVIYILGEWDSLSQHMDDFIPSPENQTLLKLVEGQVEVTSLEHLDVPLTALPIPTGQEIVSIGRHFVKTGQRNQFQDMFEASKGVLEEYVTRGAIKGGWRVDNEKEEELKEEFVLLCPWESVDEHMGFMKTEEFAKYAGTRERVDGAEIKRAKVLDLGV